MRTLEQIIEKFNELKDEYYEMGNSFRDIHDYIYGQTCGVLENYAANEKDEDLLQDLNELVDQLESHLDRISNSPDFKWIYG
jgi:hypothetical protein